MFGVLIHQASDYQNYRHQHIVWDGSGFQSCQMHHFRVIAKKPIYLPYFTIIRANIFKIQVNLCIIVEEVNVGAYLTP